MRILFVIHLYPPEHNAGGESYCHAIGKYLLSKGHEVHVLLMEASHYNIGQPYNYDGIDVFPCLPGLNLEPFINWPDRIFTHLTFASWTIGVGRIYKKPVYFLSHNTHPYECVLGSDLVKVVYNSEGMKKILNYQKPSFVLHPPVDFRKWDIQTPTIDNEYITQISLNANKGGKLFWVLAEALPNKKFLGVIGSYDPQVKKDLPNVTLLPNSPNILDIYRKTRIILMPSEYESWGMVATEAMCSGIPVIYNPTFGLTENVGKAGIPVERVDKWDEELGGDGDGISPCPENVEKWVKAIESLDNRQFYVRVSNRCRKRSRELDPENELSQFEKWIMDG